MTVLNILLATLKTPFFVALVASVASLFSVWHVLYPAFYIGSQFQRSAGLEAEGRVDDVVSHRMWWSEVVWRFS